MAEKKLLDKDLEVVRIIKFEYGLSLMQCCLWLERKKNISISRTQLYRRLNDS